MDLPQWYLFSISCHNPDRGGDRAQEGAVAASSISGRWKTPA
jgi:hypothetical protein